MEKANIFFLSYLLFKYEILFRELISQVFTIFS